MIYGLFIIVFFVQDTYTHVLVGREDNDLCIFFKSVKGCEEMEWCPSGFGCSMLEGLTKNEMVSINYILKWGILSGWLPITIW